MDWDEAKIKITKNQTGKGYIIPQLGMVSARLSEIGDLIREGNEILCRTTEGLDYTKELLTKIALMDCLGQNVPNRVISALSELIAEDLLYLVIENGGIENYLNRKARGALNARI